MTRKEKSDTRNVSVETETETASATGIERGTGIAHETDHSPGPAPRTKRPRPQSSRRSYPKKTTIDWSKKPSPTFSARAVRLLERSRTWKWTIPWHHHRDESGQHQPSIRYDEIPPECPSLASLATLLWHPDGETRRHLPTSCRACERSDRPLGVRRDPGTATWRGQGTGAGTESRTTVAAGIDGPSPHGAREADLETETDGTGVDRG